MNFQEQLPGLVSAAVTWGWHQEGLIIRNGRQLTQREYELARAVGVRHPEQVRVLVVDEIPLPDDPALRRLAGESGAVGTHTHGMTLGHGIYLLRGHIGERLLSHELRHVHQYEILGGLEWFMAVYVPQVALLGYKKAPLERDARAAAGEPA